MGKVVTCLKNQAIISFLVLFYTSLAQNCNETVASINNIKNTKQLTINYPIIYAYFKKDYQIDIKVHLRL